MTIISQMTEQVLEGKALNTQQFQDMVATLKNNTYDEAQLAAWLMAVRCKGLSLEETADLTMAMVTHSDGDLISIVDKHSTGGVGDSVTFLALPIASACGIPIIKLSGIMLGFTGGTVDKLLAIPGIVLDKSPEEIHKQVDEVGLYIGMQTGEICFADKIMYELRNRTGSVESIPLIASSILSKKLSTGAKNLVIDLKYGNGAFMKDKDSAEKLKEYMTFICNKAGVGLRVILEEANEPLASKIGTGIEVKNALRLLDARELYDEEDQKLLDTGLEVASAMIELALHVPAQKAQQEAKKALTSGAASNTFCAMIQSQSGDLEAFHAQKPDYKFDIQADYGGILRYIDTAKLGSLINDTSLYGAETHKPDPTFGVTLYKRTGETLKRGDTLMRISYNKRELQEIDRVAPKLRDCFHIERMRVSFD